MFLQKIMVDLFKSEQIKSVINSKDYDGVYVKVYANKKNYNIHLRTDLTLKPWQYYSYTFFI